FEVFKGKDKNTIDLGVFSPDGSRVIAALRFYDPNGKGPGGMGGTGVTSYEFEVLEVATGKSTQLKDMPSDGQLVDWDWSPKSDRLAYVWRPSLANRPPRRGGVLLPELKVYVCEADGRNAKEIHKVNDLSLRSFMWR